MKKIGTMSLGLTYAGCFLGAGFVSGQEIWQFFGAFGVMGILGIFLTFALHFLFGVVLIKLIHNTNITEMDKLVVWKNVPWLRAFVGGVTTFFMFSILVIMSAGAGALISRMFSVPYSVGCGFFCIAVAIVSLKGVEGMVSALSRLVPLMIIGGVLIGIITVLRHSFTFDFAVNTQNYNGLLQNWVFSAFTYASHNLFCTIGILAPLALNIDKKTIVPGIGAGSIMMILIAVCVVFGIFSNTAVSNAQLPMLELAYNISSVFAIVYAILLLFGMFGTSISSIVGVVSYIEQKSNWFMKHKKTMVILLVLIGFICSFAGFADLIGFVYPISGYFGF
ncbi:MAG: hypothetical protein UH854_07535, partial [Clostridia bacterium]|nr:hypothetical protein [Clostridia bacterium]